MPDLLCLGEPLFELSHIGGVDWREGIGGDISNVAIAAARQGASVGIVSRLGRDAFGAAIRAAWEREGVDHSFTHDDDAPTGIYFIRHGADGHSFEYRRTGSAASCMTPADLPPLKCAVLHVSGITLAISDTMYETAFAAASQVRAAGGQLSYDPNLRLNLTTLEAARAAQAAWMDSGCEIALPGLDDARKLTGLDSPEDIVKFYQKAGAKIVALTLGEEGALLADESGLHYIAARKTKLVDASGAGDCFDGCFLARILEGATPLEAARYAVAAASLCVEGYGAVTPIPTRARVLTECSSKTSP